MKVLQIVQKPQMRGAEIFASQLSNHLQKSSVDVHLVSLFKGDIMLPFSGKITHLGRPRSKRLLDRKAWWEIAEIVKLDNPDIVQTNAADTLKYTVLSKFIYGWQQPIVVRNASTLSSYIKHPVHKAYNKFLYDQADAIASVSEHSRKDLIKLYPSLKGRAVTIPIGLEDIKGVVNPFTSFNKMVKNLVHVGGFTYEKNHKGLLSMFAKIIETKKDVHLWLVGDGPLRPSIEKQVKETGLEHLIHFTGFVDNPLDYIAHAQALLLSSIIEGLPGVILEAMLYKTPVVAFDVGGIGEAVINNETGWLIEPRNEQRFIRAVNEVLSLDEDIKSHITTSAKELVVQNYMNQEIAKKFIKLYERVLSNQKKISFDF